MDISLIHGTTNLTSGEEDKLINVLLTPGKINYCYSDGYYHQQPCNHFCFWRNSPGFLPAYNYGTKIFV